MEQEKQLSYLVIGSGGTGGTLGAYLAKGGKQVTMIARGAHLQAIKENGLRIVRPEDEFIVNDLHAADMDSYKRDLEEGLAERPDVIFVCVKGYSIPDTIPFIRQAAKPDTVVIPILNIYGTGEQMQKELPELLVTDGCIYVAAQIREPGCILMKGYILRVIFGVRSREEERGDVPAVLRRVEQDLKDSDVTGVLSDNIRRDALLKFSYVSPQGACGLFYDAAAGELQKPGELRDCFAALIHEIDLLAEAMNIHFEEDIVKRNLAILDDLAPSMTTSLQRDVAAGKSSEIDGLIYSVVRMGDTYGVDLPVYRKIAAALQARGLS